MKSSLSSSTGCAHIRCGYKGATRRRTPIVTRIHNDTCRADFDNVVADAAPRRLPRTQPRDGVAFRGGARDAGAKGERRSKIAHSHCSWPRVCHRQCGVDFCVPRHDAAAHGNPLAYLVVTGLLSWVVYRKLGLALLRKTWLNFELVWVAALVATGLVTLLI